MQDQQGPFDWSTFKPSELAVLTFVRDSGSILLIRKLRGLGAGKINAPGGRIEPGETAEDAARRETEEEVGLSVGTLHHMARLHFAFVDGYTLRVEVFVTDDYSGTPVRTDEADPLWVLEHHIPFDEMWEDDRHWLPEVLEGRRVELYGYFDGDTMLSGDLRRLAE